ncbi:Rv2175c family DNA-binding protein [Sanguibacter sp. HDW7]|uniref:Rv2175c family DNA-binding protein n=1 Tax=Sanguibacter sp. HDW7 TaxID=2714931 RepID=UPI001407A9AF|nr:Rv2175c family DNA-binding protein [Sanguibacter sp. HDW7]QIK83695.1 DNA-binding protein [Sanguibacter sp. HDW7]
MTDTTYTGEWLTLPAVAELLGTDVAKVRGMLHDRVIVAVRRGENPVKRVPADFFVPRHLQNPADRRTPVEGEHPVPLPSLQGTIALLGDLRFDDEGIIDWLLAHNEEIGASPLAALREGRKSEVRRVAQSML